MNIAQIRHNYPQYGSMSDQQLASALHKKYYSTMPFQEFSQRIGLVEERHDASEDTGAGEAFLVGAGKRGVDLYRGAADLGAKLGEFASDNPLTNALEYITGRESGSTAQNFRNAQQGISEQQQFANQQTQSLEAARPLATGLGGAAVDTLATLPGAAAAQSGRLVRMGANAVSAALPAAVEVGTFEQRQNRALRAGAIGLGMSGLFEAAGMTVNAARNAFAEGAKNRVAQQLEALGIPVAIADLVDPTSAIAKLDDAVANIPLIGTGARKRAQLAGIKKTLETLRDKYSIKGEVEDTIALSLQKARDAAKAKAKELYDEVERLGDGEILFPKNFAQNLKVQKALTQKVRPQLQDQSAVQALKSMDGLDSAMTFTEARALRSRLGDMIDQNEMQNRPLARLFTQMKTALESDIDEMGAKAGGELGKAWNTAKKFYAEKVLPFQNREITDRIAAGKIDADQILGKALASGKWENFNRLYKNATTDGRAALEYSVIDKALDAARVIRPDGSEVFKPGAFAAQVRKMERMIGKSFPADRAQEITGMAKLMDSLRGLDAYAAPPPTGYKAGQTATALGAGAVGTVAAAGNPIAQAGVGLTIGFKALLGSSRGRRLLRAMAKVGPQTEEGRMLARTIMNYQQRAATSLINDTVLDEEDHD